MDMPEGKFSEELSEEIGNLREFSENILANSNWRDVSMTEFLERLDDLLSLIRDQIGLKTSLEKQEFELLTRVKQLMLNSYKCEFGHPPYNFLSNADLTSAIERNSSRFRPEGRFSLKSYQSLLMLGVKREREFIEIHSNDPTNVKITKTIKSDKEFFESLRKTRAPFLLLYRPEKVEKPPIKIWFVDKNETINEITERDFEGRTKCFDIFKKIMLNAFNLNSLYDTSSDTRNNPKSIEEIRSLVMKIRKTLKKTHEHLKLETHKRAKLKDVTASSPIYKVSIPFHILYFTA
jgi:hypothetical protein